MWTIMAEFNLSVWQLDHQNLQHKVCCESLSRKILLTKLKSNLANKEQKLKFLGEYSTNRIIIHPIAMNDKPYQNHHPFYRIFSPT